MRRHPNRKAGAATLPMMRASCSIDGVTGRRSIVLCIHFHPASNVANDPSLRRSGDRI